MKGKGMNISLLKQLFHNGQQTRDGVRKIYESMI